MRTSNLKPQRGFFLIIVVAVLVIIMVAVLFTTGVIETPEPTAASGNCEKLHEHCKASCDNDSNCKNDCLTIYQQCKSEAAR
jgi:hypothetical protein